MIILIRPASVTALKQCLRLACCSEVSAEGKQIEATPHLALALLLLFANPSIAKWHGNAVGVLFQAASRSLAQKIKWQPCYEDSGLLGFP